MGLYAQCTLKNTLHLFIYAKPKANLCFLSPDTYEKYLAFHPNLTDFILRKSLNTSFYFKFY